MAPRRSARRVQEEPEPEPEVEMDHEEELEEELEEADEDEADQGDGGDLIKLKFNEELSWRPGRPIATGTLLSRLDKLSRELIDMDQDTVDTDSLAAVAQALGSRNLITHKDAGVRAKTASCLVEILRLCVPDAPFTEEQIQTIFVLFIKVILPGLQDPQHPYYRDHKHVLESLSEVKSILLLDDIEKGDELLEKLFSCCFDTVSVTATSVNDEQVPKEVVFHMTQLLATMVDEGSNITGPVVEIIMAQFLRAAPPGGKADRGEQDGSQSTLLLKTEPEAYVMAKTVCNSSPERMSRFVSQYFTEVIMDASQFATKSNGHRHGDEEEDEHPTGPSESDLKELRKAHLLIRELWRACPAILQNVVPQVDAELSADNVHLRQIATETLGDLISGIGAAGPPPPPTLDPAAYPHVKLADEPPAPAEAYILTTPRSPQSFAQTHSGPYHNFLGRKNDKIATIRAAWTTAVGYILSTSAGGIGLSREEQSSLVKALGEKLNDADEKVRLAAVKAVELFSFRDIVTVLGASGGVEKEGSVLGSLADRCRDTRAVVRVEATVLLGKLWAVASGEIAAGQEVVTAALSGIPSRIIGVFFINDNELNVLLDRVLFECLVPLSYPPLKGAKGGKGAKSQAATLDRDRIRAERILLLAKALDPNVKKAFFGIQSRQPQFARVIEVFIQQCEAWNGGVTDNDGRQKMANLSKTIEYISQFFPDAPKVQNDLHKFAKTHDRRNYQLIKFMVAIDTDYTTVRRAISDLTQRISASSAAPILDTLIAIIYRSATIMFNRSHFPTIMDYSKTDKDGLGQVAHEILNEVSTKNPTMFKTHLAELHKQITQQAPTDKKPNDPSTADILRACSSYSKKYPDEISQDRAFLQSLISYALYAQPPPAAKFAVNILLAKKDDKSMVNATALLQKVMKDWTYGAPHFITRLATVSQLELLAPKVTLDADDEILNMTVQKLLLEVRTDALESDPGWVEDADMNEELQAKLLSLKILVNRLRSTEDETEAKERAKPVFKLLRTLVVKGGELCKVKDTPKHHKARLRLRAAQLMLKLCTVKHFELMLTPELFDELAFMTQDPEPQVRKGFVGKLQKYLAQSKLNYRYLTIIFLTAFEPMADFKQQVETWIRSRSHVLQMREPKIMGAIMARLLSLLAHHPDYNPELDLLVDHARYILYFVNLVATEDNLGLIAKYAERVKQTRDAVKPSESERLYVLSDLAQAVIRKWQEKKGWSFQAYGEKIGLPSGLYSHLPSHEVAVQIAQKQYIPDGIEEKLDDLLKSVDRRKKRKSMDDRGEGHPAKKARAEPKERSKDKPKVAKPPKAPKAVKAKVPKPKRRASSSTAADVPIGQRRRSGRARATGPSYVERDDKEDEEEMMLGVAKWDYVDEDDSDVEDESESEVEEDEEEEEVEEERPAKRVASTKKPPKKPVESEESALSEPEEAEEETPPPAPKSNGRKAAAPVPKAAPTKRGRVVPKLQQVKPTPKVAPAAKAKATEAPAPKGRRGKAKETNDPYAMDLDD